MEPIKKIIMLTAGGLIILGFIIAMAAFALGGFNWRTLNASLPDEKKSYTYDLAGVSNLSLSELDTDVKIVGTDGDQIKIECYENEKDSYTIKLLENGNLSIDRSLFKHWYEQIGFLNFNLQNKKRELTVAIPKKFSGELEVSTVSGNLIVSDLDHLKDVNTSTSAGQIDLKNLSIAQQLEASTISGNLDLSQVSAGGNLELGTASGTIQVSQGKTDGSLSASSISGAMKFDETTIAGPTTIENSSGNIQFNKLSGHDFYFSNLSGNIRGSLLGDPATYTITADSLSGKQNLPNFGNGKNSLEVSTASGNIDIEFLPVN